MFPRIQLLLDQGRFADAEVAIREMLKEDMEDSLLFYLLAVALLRQDKPKEAEDAANTAISLEPYADAAFAVLSQIRLAQKDKAGALKAINQAIEIDPEDADHFSQKAQVYVDWAKFDKALVAAEAGLAVDPDNEGCRFFRSFVLGRLGRDDEADEMSLGLLSDDPEDAENHSVRGWVLAQRGDCEAAERHFAEALRISPDSEDARNGLAFTFKMRNPVLGWFLKALIKLEQIPIWWFLIGVWVVLQFGNKLAASDLPFPIPQAASLLRILIWGFFVIALLIQPLFNLILSRSKTARHALTHDELQGVRWGMLPLIIGLLFLIYWAVRGGGVSAPIHAVAWASIAVLAYETYETGNLWVRKRMAIVGWIALAVAIWIEVYSWGFQLPRIKEIMDEQMALKRAEAEDDAFKPVIEKWMAFRSDSFNYVYLPGMALWLLGAFADNVRELFTRMAPDE